MPGTEHCRQGGLDLWVAPAVLHGVDLASQTQCVHCQHYPNLITAGALVPGGQHNGRGFDIVIIVSLTCDGGIHLGHHGEVWHLADGRHQVRHDVRRLGPEGDGRCHLDVADTQAHPARCGRSTLDDGSP
ncbi:hypothetical protein D3C72_1382460 [compost metagenome]